MLLIWQPPSASARAKIRVTLLALEVLPTGRKNSQWSILGVNCLFFYMWLFCNKGTSKLTNTASVSWSLCRECNTTLCCSMFCHVTCLVITKAAFRVLFCDKAAVCTAPKSLNAVKNWEAGKYIALVLSWAKHYFFLNVRTCIHICASLSVGARLLLNFVQILCHFKLNNDLKLSGAPMNCVRIQACFVNASLWQQFFSCLSFWLFTWQGPLS